MTLADIYKPVQRELGAVEEQLLGLSQVGNELIRNPLSSILAAGGKRLRPALVLIAAKACASANGDGAKADGAGSADVGEGDPTERSIGLAVATELIHTASLIHDDVIDNATVRRGAPTINARWGHRVSILVGDHLYAKVVNILAEHGNREAIRSIADATSRMTDSELTQNLCQNDVGVTEEKYLSIIAGKTASLMACSCRLGAFSGQVRDGAVDRMTEYGTNLGMAFQITDDLLDVTGDEALLGKAPGTDIREGKMTLPFIHMMGVAEGEDRDWAASVFASGEMDASAFARMKELAERYGGIEYSLGKAKGYVRSCKEALRGLRGSESKQSLAMLADYVLARGN